MSYLLIVKRCELYGFSTIYKINIIFIIIDWPPKENSIEMLPDPGT